MPYTNLIASGAYYGIRSVNAPGVCLHETPDYLVQGFACNKYPNSPDFWKAINDTTNKVFGFQKDNTKNYMGVQSSSQPLVSTMPSVFTWIVVPNPNLMVPNPFYGLGVRIMDKNNPKNCVTLDTTNTTAADGIPVKLSECKYNDNNVFQDWLLHAQADFLNVNV